ncbi:MAG TPA: ABC transporter permease [Candidatus Acidoferrales bacterium]|jgi:predicted permease|nr:ABC transporter permease [Candidatus Acidoferrales bacterium]
MTPKKNSMGDRFFRRLVKLFPSEFRSDFGGEMEKVFQQQRHEAGGGFLGLLRLWGETIVGIFRTAPGEHLEMFRQDGGFAVRMMRKNKGFTALVICILALGIGANTAIFSVVNGVLLRPLPFVKGDRLVSVNQAAPRAGYDKIPFSVHEINDIREQSQTLEAVVEYHNMQFDLLGVGDPQRINTGVVSANFFDVLGVKPIYGRTFVPDDEKPGAPAVMVFSYEYWNRVYGGDPNVVGTKFRMNNMVHTAIGVLPPMPQYPDENDVYMPTSDCPFRSNPKFIANRSARMMTVFGRLREGKTIEQAQAELMQLESRFRQAFPKDYESNVDWTMHAGLLRNQLTQQARPTFLILMGTAGLVLLIVCANVANLSLSRQLRRGREMAVRAALGASRSRLLRQMVTESTILSLAGGALGLLIASWSVDLLAEFAARFTQRASEVKLDSHVMLFCLGISVLTGVLFGSIPAIPARENLSGPMREGTTQWSSSKPRERARSVLIVAQVALSFALLAGAGLMLRSFYKLVSVNPGYSSENVISMLVQLNFTKYGGDDSDSKIRAFQHRLLERVKANPAVVSAAIGLNVPLNQKAPFTERFEIDGRAKTPGQPDPTFDLQSVTADYFQLLGIALDRGRYLTSQDGDKAPLAVTINESMAHHYWKDEDPIGHRISTDGGEHWATIVGVVGDVRQYGMDKPAGDVLYVSQDQDPFVSGTLLVRAQQNPNAIVKQLIDDVHAIDPEQPVARIRTLDQLRQQSLAPPRLTSTLLGLFAMLALVITAAGIAGVMGLAVNQRIKEIGIRMALGASGRSVLQLFLGRGLLPVTIGLAIGLAGALAGTRILSGLLFGVEPNDPLTLTGVALLLLGVAAVACYAPARRATRVDPLAALRSE